MEWLFILVLGGVAVWQGVRIGALNRRVAQLERRFAALATAPPVPAHDEAQIAPSPAPQDDLVLDQPLPAGEPLLLDTPIADQELLLDTPLPEASNDTEAELAPPPPPPVERARAAPALSPLRDFRFDQWLAEKGFAWIAGSALALGAIFLVSFAAQQRWFTPQLQLGLALALGVGLLGASEWARRASLQRPPGHPLIAALLAGGGVVTLYATAWAAHGLHGFIDFPTAAALLAICALALIGLSFLHGHAIGVLAVLAALLTPALSHEPLWPSLALSLYVGGIGAAGFALAVMRRWAWVALATLVGLYVWFWAAIAADELRRALALLSFASFGAVALALRPPLADVRTDAWRAAHALGPTIAVAVSSVFLVFVWAAVGTTPTGLIAGPALISVFHVALAAYAVRGRVAQPPALIVAVLGLVAGSMGYLQTRFYAGPLSADFYAVMLTAALATVICAAVAGVHRRWRVAVAATGAGGAGLLFVLVAFTRAEWNALGAWAPLFGGALLFLAAAWHGARHGAGPRSARVVDIWAGAAAALVLLGIESAFPAEARTAAHAGSALLFASGFAWRGWRVLRFSALAAAAIAIAHALAPSLIGGALAGDIPIWGALLILAVAAVLLFGAGYFATAEPRSPYGEALSAAGVVTLLIGAFLLLRWLAAGDQAPLDTFSESALRVVALMAAGHIVLARPGQQLGRIGRWRGHVLLGLGLLYTLIVPVLAINPWWGSPPAFVSGPYLLDSVALAFAAPAAIAFAAARRLYLSERAPARAYAISAGALALLWAVLELRRVAHPAQMSGAPVGPLEAAAYALLFLGAALGVAVVARLRAAKHAEGPFTQDLSHATRWTAWGALIAAGLLLLVGQHPWWGAHDGAPTDAVETALAVLAQLLGVGLALALGRAHSISRAADPLRFAAATAALLLAWSFGHAAIRWLYHQGGMDDGGPFVGLEGFAHTLWPLVFVLVGAQLTTRAPGRDTVRAYLYDLQALWSAAVWPALGFAALGLWVLFNPWWGVNPVEIATPVSASAAFACLLAAAWLSLVAANVPHLPQPQAFARVAIGASIVHVLVFATLAARWLHHGAAMSAAPAGEVELWVYSAVWAVYGTGVFWVGLRRNHALLRWSGLVILLLTTIYVYLLIFTQLTGFIRALTAIGLALVLFVVAWISRTYRAGPKPTDLVNVTPGARRERRYGRRQRSQ